MNFVGFDPGGKNSFGWAVLKSTASGLELIGKGTCSSAPDAVLSAHMSSKVDPSGFAIDAPLFWVDSGDRQADCFVRKLVCSAGGRSGTVSHINSLRGACLVQGAQVARLASARWPGAKATEAHPKALIQLDHGARSFLKTINGSVTNDHERDAALAAYTAAAFVNQVDGWHDLALQEHEPFFPSAPCAAYWFPQART
jgi:hypothetical protein